MIQYVKDGTTVSAIDDKGTKVSASPFDGSKYTALLAIMDAQISATAENNHAVDLYNNSLKNAQISVDAGRSADAPPKPLQKVVSDIGVTTYVPFNPPLADLVPLAVTAPSSGAIAVPTEDTQAIMYAMLTAIYRKMFPAG